jgi:hypothetical protein
MQSTGEEDMTARLLLLRRERRREREREASRDARYLKGAAMLQPGVACRPLLVFVQPSSERTREPVREDCSFAEKQECHPARLLVGA